MTGEVSLDDVCDDVGLSGRSGSSPIGTEERKCEARLPETGSSSWLARGKDRWISFSSSKSLCVSLINRAMRMQWAYDTRSRPMEKKN